VNAEELWCALHGATKSEAEALAARVDVDPRETQAVLTLIGYRSSVEGQATEQDPWESYWESLSPAERVAELRSMDAHVADVERRRAEGEPA
jgi:hypothetical protein